MIVLFTMKHDKWKVFFPALVTMMGMHLISVSLGLVFPLFFSRSIIVYFSIALFFFFGIMMIYEAYHMPSTSAEEKIQILENDLHNGSDPEAAEKTTAPGDKIDEESKTLENTNEVVSADETEAKDKYFCTNPYLHLVVLLFFTEWGDRSQISAIVLTATQNIWGVAVGGALVLLFNEDREWQYVRL